jgi:hypothetical protein
MASDLKVYNRFDELTLHVRLSLDDGPELYTVDGTPEMRTAIASLKGVDFDRTVVKNNEHLRFTADWGSPGYLTALGRYFVTNFGWRTKIVETEEPSARVGFIASGNFAPQVYYSEVTSVRAVASTMVMVNINEDRPDWQPTTVPITSRAASENVFATT